MSSIALSRETTPVRVPFGATVETMLTQALITEGLHAVAAGADPIAIARAIEAAVALAVGASSDDGLEVPVASRIEDAARAACVTTEDGVALGDATALVRLRRGVDRFASTLDDPDEATGVRAVHRALAAPISQLAVNAGHDPDVVITRVEGICAGTSRGSVSGHVYGSSNAGIELERAIRDALHRASSAAALILTTECMLAANSELSHAR